MNGQNNGDWNSQVEAFLNQQGQGASPLDPWSAKVNDFLNQQSTQSPSKVSNWEDFKSVASKLAAEHNFPASVLLGQAALESGRGTSTFAKDRNNYFGYMAYDQDPNMAKSYQNPGQSIMDYINLIENSPRYAQHYQKYLEDKNPVSLLQGIKAAGYATDPNYVTKVLSTPEFKQNL